MTRFDPARIFETLDQPIPGGTHEAGIIAAPRLMRTPSRHLVVAQARLERTEPGPGRRGGSGNAHAPETRSRCGTGHFYTRKLVSTEVDEQPAAGNACGAGLQREETDPACLAASAHQMLTYGVD